MNITEKLLEARKRIKETSIKKDGRNNFTNYDYFTPSQVSELVNSVCQELRILPLFSLNKDEFGLYGQLNIYDLEIDKDTESDSIETIMYTEMPSIKATNMTQQMGGCETYTKRYMLMSAFDITDNNLDFDSQDNRPKAKEGNLDDTFKIIVDVAQDQLNKTRQTPVESPQANPKVKTDILACTTLEQLERFYMGFNTEEKILYKQSIDNQKLKLA